MKTVIFYGEGDDLIEIEGDIEGADEYYDYGVATSPRIDVAGIFALISDQTNWMKIYALYDGCWHFSIGPFDEDMPMPSWPIRYSLHERGYSVQMEIDVPDGVRLVRLDKQD